MLKHGVKPIVELSFMPAALVSCGSTVRARPWRSRALSVLRRESVLYGAFVWARRALSSQKRRFPARADHGVAEDATHTNDWSLEGVRRRRIFASVLYSNPYLSLCITIGGTG